MAHLINRRALLTGAGGLLVAGSFRQPASLDQSGETAKNSAMSRLVLTEADVADLIKLVSTEVVPTLNGSALAQQTRGVTDCVLNRLKSKKWGVSIADVANAPWQFSGINSNLKGAYGSLSRMPDGHVKANVSRQVRIWLALRAAGARSTVAGHLNYLNPNFSSARSLTEWGNSVVKQAVRNSMVFGAGKAV